MPGNLGIFQSPSAVSERRYSQADMVRISRQSMPMAREFAKPGHEEMLEIASKSTDVSHRVAAAWAYGLGKKQDSGLTGLLGDNDPLVVLAARESCSYIAREKFGVKCTDFGPFADSGPAERSHARELWEMWFEKRAEALATIEKNKPIDGAKRTKDSEKAKGTGVQRVGAPAGPDPYAILGLDPKKD